MSGSIQSWFFRLPVVILVAASMGWLGLSLMYFGTPFFPMPDGFWSQYVMLASIAVWAPATVYLRGRKLPTWAAFGAVSPLLGALLVAPPASLAFVIAMGYIAFPVGITTGIIMYWLVCTKIGRRHAIRPTGGSTVS